MDSKKIKVWDLPTRIFHWSLVILIAAAIVTGNLGGSAMDWHGRIGLAILGLLAFRIAWGFVGSSHARFAKFLPTPSAIRTYLRGQWHGFGHNPLGALSVFAMLALITLQLATGLVANDDIAFRGPLFDLTGKALSDKLTGVHKFSINFLIALIILHLGAIIFYALSKRENLVKPMIYGWKEIGAEEAKKATLPTGGGVLALITALLFSLTIVYIGSGLWLQNTPPIEQAAPEW